MTPLIKICGIKDPETAYAAAKLGADWIGIVLVPESKRSVTFEAAQEICAAAHEGGAKTIAIFYAVDAEALCELPLDGAQFYGPCTLPDALTRFYANHCPLDRKDGYLLIENPQGGSGKMIDPASLFPTPGWLWFLAGGLTPGNVRGCIGRFHPHGVDVSSGVEKDGRKDKSLIQKFIEEVRHG
jgi:phosphoribosylanthranilate isomerase